MLPDQIEKRLLQLAALFAFFYSIALTLAPAARAHTWGVNYPWQHWIGFFSWLVMVALAHSQARRWLPERDPYLIPLAAFLGAWGSLTIWRVYPSFGLRQSIWLLISLGVLCLGLRLPSELRFLRRYKYVWLSAGLILTTFTLVFGTNPLGYGPRLWLGCCGLYFQPSEPLKLLLLMYLSAYFAGFQPHPDSVQQPKLTRSDHLLPLLAPTLLLTGLALLLMVVQRDLGTASIFLFLFAAVAYVTTGQPRVLWASGLAILLAGIAGYVMFDVVSLRVDAWLNPWQDPSGRSYQIVQSLLAISNGGLIGRGPGLGSPGLVPIPHSDFIFSAIVEESGLLGALGLLAMLALLVDRGIRAAIHAPDAYRRFLAAGLTAHLVGQSILIIGGNLRLLPLTGVTLPFVSYGGSSLLTSFLSMLILLHISSRTEDIRPVPLQNTHPYLHLSALLMGGLAAAGLVSGWWTFYRGPALLTRTDNPRRAIADRFVQRGAILDRSAQPLANSTGQPGAYSRQVHYPALSPVIGYTSPVYGQAGLEASLDGYLRGLVGNPELVLWWDYLLYGQPPPGLDIRTTLDPVLQLVADQAFGENIGGLVLMNAANGEILSMVSHPYFDANQIDQEGDALVQDERAPLFNRASLGRYPTGELFASLFPHGLSEYGLDKAFNLRLQTGDPPPADEETPALSPLQMVLAAATLSGSGQRPAPLLVSAVRIPGSGWEPLAALETSLTAFDSEEAQSRVSAMDFSQSGHWRSIAVVLNLQAGAITWYVGGTLPGWSGTPVALALVLEEDQPTVAQQIGEAIFRAALR